MQVRRVLTVLTPVVMLSALAIAMPMTASATTIQDAAQAKQAAFVVSELADVTDLSIPSKTCAASLASSR